MKCPKCDATITSSSIRDLDGKVGFQSRWKCIAHTCPQCSCVLSVQIDPVALKTDTVDAVKSVMSGMLSQLAGQVTRLENEIRQLRAR